MARALVNDRDAADLELAPLDARKKAGAIDVFEWYFLASACYKCIPADSG